MKRKFLAPVALAVSTLLAITPANATAPTTQSTNIEKISQVLKQNLTKDSLVIKKSNTQLAQYGHYSHRSHSSHSSHYSHRSHYSSSW